MNLQECVETFLLSQPNLSTRKAYRSCLYPMREFIGNTRDIYEVEVSDVVKYADKLYTKNYAKATIRKHVISIKAFFNFLKKNRVIDYSPADAIKRPKRQHNIGRDKAMPDDLLEKYLSYAQWNPRLNALVRFLADTGCRIGGANDLKVDDIDFIRRTAKVTEKGSKTRPVAFGESTAEALQVWLDARSLNACNYVFSTSGSQIKVANLAQFFRRHGEKAKIGSWGPHSLRHRKGKQLADAKVAPSVSAEALGHERVLTTMEYYYPHDWERAQKAIDSLTLDATKQSPNILRFPKKRVQ